MEFNSGSRDATEVNKSVTMTGPALEDFHHHHRQQGGGNYERRGLFLEWATLVIPFRSSSAQTDKRITHSLYIDSTTSRRLSLEGPITVTVPIPSSSGNFVWVLLHQRL